jgi:protein TonB
VPVKGDFLRIFTKSEKEPGFPGGAMAWKTFLEQNLRAEVAANDGTRPGVYTVTLQFIVDSLGNISDVRTIRVPRECPSCGPESIRVIKKSPNWIPAEQNHHKVYFQAKQDIIFTVVR